MIEVKQDKKSKIYQIARYLKEHGESTSADIAKGVGSRNLIVHEVSNICSRHPEIFTMTKVNRQRNVYSLNSEVVFV